jgi:hypothetical protein
VLAIGCANGAASPAASFRGDLRKLVLDRAEVPRGFAPSGPAITQDFYDESSPKLEPWLYVGDVRHGQLVTAAFSEFRNRTGKVILDSEAYRAPTSAAARAMFRAAARLVARSANGVGVARTVRREQIGSGGVLLAGPGLNGEGAHAVLWRDGLLLGMVAIDGGDSPVSERLVQQLARRQEGTLDRALRRQR